MVVHGPACIPSLVVAGTQMCCCGASIHVFLVGACCGWCCFRVANAAWCLWCRDYGWCQCVGGVGVWDVKER